MPAATKLSSTRLDAPTRRSPEVTRVHPLDWEALGDARPARSNWELFPDDGLG
jgi:hypothetical protein